MEPPCTCGPDCPNYVDPLTDLARAVVVQALMAVGLSDEQIQEVMDHIGNLVGGGAEPEVGFADMMIQTFEEHTEDLG